MFLPFVFLLLAFFVGAIPTGYLIGKYYSIDIRKVGSGNTGATNVKRACGKKAGLLTLICDILKGSFAVVILSNLYGNRVSLADGSEFSAFIGLAAILGHCFSPFLGFKGGKGVATSLGVFLVLSPYSAVIALICYAVVKKGFGFVSLGSLISAISIPVANYLFISRYGLNVFWISVIAALLIIIRHKENIRRLLNKEELRA
ncbi:MAG: glycerol-3-phosphate 1-O-acyltransferase PlsY [Deltaproteobacteria bacterium]|nr:glycerol-3-phosphate 1-O-acyltransferase PlsY [Deltaproteobacteria bacterium]